MYWNVQLGDTDGLPSWVLVKADNIHDAIEKSKAAYPGRNIEDAKIEKFIIDVL